MEFNCPWVRRNAFTNCFENPLTHTKYLGVHKLMERWMMRAGQTLELYHKLLDSDKSVSKKCKRGFANGMEFGEMLHDQVALLLRLGHWEKKHTECHCLQALMNAIQRRGWTALQGDVKVADRRLKIATGVDLLASTATNAFRIIEIKVYKTFEVADTEETEFGNLKPPFDVMLCTTGWLAGVQACLTMFMFQQAFPNRDSLNDEAWVAIISRDEEKCQLRPVSGTARAAAGYVLMLHKASTCDLKKGQNLVAAAYNDARRHRTSFDKEYAKRKRAKTQTQINQHQMRVELVWKLLEDLIDVGPTNIVRKLL